MRAILGFGDISAELWRSKEHDRIGDLHRAARRKGERRPWQLQNALVIDPGIFELPLAVPYR